MAGMTTTADVATDGAAATAADEDVATIADAASAAATDSAAEAASDTTRDTFNSRSAPHGTGLTSCGGRGISRSARRVPLPPPHLPRICKALPEFAEVYENQRCARNHCPRAAHFRVFPAGTLSILLKYLHGNTQQAKPIARCVISHDRLQRVATARRIPLRIQGTDASTYAPSPTSVRRRHQFAAHLLPACRAEFLYPAHGHLERLPPSGEIHAVACGHRLLVSPHNSR